MRNAQTTAETIANEHGGSYANVTATELAAVEPTIAITESKQHAWLSNATPGANEYSITATATDGDELTISRAADGTVTRTCQSPELRTGCWERKTRAGSNLGETRAALGEGPAEEALQPPRISGVSRGLGVRQAR